MIVMKFGGTSVESAAAIERVAKIVGSRRKQSPVVVVVSAMAKVTDQLVAMGLKAATGECEASLVLLQSLRERHLQAALELLGAKKCAALIPKLEAVFSDLESFLRGLAGVRELTPRGSDYLLSFGELLSSLIVADAFAVRGLNAAWVDSRECLVTDAKQRRKYLRCFQKNAFRSWADSLRQPPTAFQQLLVAADRTILPPSSARRSTPIALKSGPMSKA